MAYNTELEERLQILLQGRKGVTSKKMFGGVAFMLDEKMFAGITGDNLMARINPEDEAGYLKQKHVRQMDFTGRPMRGYLYIAPAGIEDDKDLALWVDRCMEFVATVKKKPMKKKK